MVSRKGDFPSIFAGVLAFYVIMTFNLDKLNQGEAVAWIKIILGSLAVLYLLLNGYRKIKKEPHP